MSPENGSDIQQKIEYVKKSLPKEMVDAASKFSPEEFLQRVEIYKDLQKSYNILEKNSKRLTSVEDTYLTPLREILNLQHWVAISGKGDFAKPVTTRFEGWEGNDMNFNYTSKDTVSVGELIARYTRNSKKIGEFLGGTQDQVQSKVDPEKHERIATFIDALEAGSNDAEISAAIAKYRTRVANNSAQTGRLLESLQSVIDDNLKNAGGTLNFDSIGNSDEKLAKALRAIGDTANSGVVATRKMKSQAGGETTGDVGEDANYKKLGDFYKDNYDGFASSAQQDAEKQFDGILRSLEGYPQYLEYQNKKTEIIASLVEQNIFMKATDKYIAVYGSENLGKIGELYDDMKGLSGTFNFTDENAAMTQELAITFVSMALSFGTAGLFMGGAKLARGIQTITAAKKYTTVVQDASRLRTGVTYAQNTGKLLGNKLKAPVRGTARLAEKTLTGAAGVVRSVEAGGMAVRTAGEALKFTSAQTILEAFGPLAHSDGAKRASLESFATHFAQNAVMFGAFAGVEKFVSRPLMTKLGIVAKQGIFTGENAVLTAGDMTALIALQAIETGKIPTSPQELAQLAAMTLAFRSIPGIAQKFEKLYPKLTIKLNQLKNPELLQEAKLSQQELDALIVPGGIGLSKEDYAVALQKVPKHFGDQIGTEAYIRMVEKMAGLNNSERIAEAEKIFRKTLTPAQKDAIILAHDTGANRIFRWSKGDIKAKLEVLQYGKQKTGGQKDGKPEKELFTQEERRMLMESGLTGKPDKIELQRPVDEIITAKGSVYRYLPDGRIQRFKTKTGELQTPQDAIVFIPDYATIERMAPKSFDMKAILGENGAQMEQILLTRLHNADSKIYIVNSKGEKLETNQVIQAEPGEIYLSIGPNETKVDFIIPVSKDPRVGYQTYDTRKYRDPADPKEWRRERHIGNKIINIKYKPEAPAKYERTIPEASIDITAAQVKLSNLQLELRQLQEKIKQYTRMTIRESGENQIAIDRVKKEIQGLEQSIAQAEKGAAQDTQGRREKIRAAEDDIVSVLRLESNDPLRESLRTKIQDLMKLDDIAFEKSFRDAEARQWNNNEYEREIYTATRGVRTRTLEQLPTDITFYKERTAGYRKNQRDISEDGKPVALDAESKSMKAQFVFARIASEYRLKNTPRDIAIATNHNQFPTIIRDEANILKIVTPEGPIALPKGTQALPPEAAKNPTDWVRKGWTLGGFLLIGGILYACSGDNKNKTLTPVALTNPTTPIAAPVTPEEACHDIGTAVSTINPKRINSNGNMLTKEIRETITKRFQTSQQYKEFEKFVQENQAAIAEHGKCNDILGFLANPIVTNIQSLQRQIGMEATDKSIGQDGILGQKTLAKLKIYLETELAK